ncbi:MAG TPA: LPS assembly protein LptD [Rhizomicrobium sp.]|jgi:LPS-assembly protein|nr:LPS assembly protein LptD [Rhizomicrobium sp.]
MRPARISGAAAAALALALSCAKAEPAKPDPDILLQADEVVYDSEAQVVSARGHVEVDYGGRMLMADTLTYDQASDVMTASGHVSLLDAKGDVAFADHINLTGDMREGALDGFAALIGKTGRLAAARAKREQGRFTTAWRAAYTPCKICNKPGQRTPLWRVKSYRVVYDELKHRIKFHDATVEVLGVPVLYTPYLSEPDPSVRYTSGLLSPDIGSSSTIGYFTRVPVYIALSPSNDATIAPLLTTHGGEVLEGEYRQRWMDGGLWLQGAVGFNPNGGVSETQDQIYSDLFGSGRIPLNDHWSTGFDVQLSSDDTFLKRYDISQLDRLTSDLFVQGEAGRSRFAISGYFFQGLRATDDNRSFPVPLPLVEYTYIPEDHLLGGQFRFDFNSVALTRDLGVDDQRASAEIRWRKPFVALDGQLFTVQLDARGDVYHLDNDPLLPSSGQYVERGLPYIALDWRWPFVSDGGGAYVLQPIGQVILAPYGGNPANLPNEDSVGFELDENNLFSFDQMPGYDIVETGPRANVGFRADAIFPLAHLEALVGESFRLKPDPIFAADSGLAGTQSDIVGRFSIKFPPFIDLTHRIDIDQSTGDVRRNEVYLTGTYGRSSLQVSYVQLAPSAITLGLDSREEINAQADINFYRNWQAFAAVQRDLIAGEMINTEYGIGYEDECLAVALAYRRKYTSEPGLPPSTAIILHVGLKTGDQPIQPFSLFHQDIFTYNRP